jgi:hypothetical protein
MDANRPGGRPPGGALQRQARAALGRVQAPVTDRHAEAVADELEQPRIVGAEAAPHHARGEDHAHHVAVHRLDHALLGVGHTGWPAESPARPRSGTARAQSAHAVAGVRSAVRARARRG